MACALLLPRAMRQRTSWIRRRSTFRVRFGRSRRAARRCCESFEARAPPDWPRPFSRRARAPRLRVRVLDGARRVGAKILVSGGSRCNVTNRVVTERDFWGGPPRLVARVLRAFPADRAPRGSSPISACRCTKKSTANSFPTRTPRAPCSTRCWPRRPVVSVAVETGSRVVAVEHDGRAFSVEDAQMHARSPRAPSCWRPGDDRFRKAAATASATASRRVSGTPA